MQIFQKLNNNCAQSTLEYVLLGAAVVAVLAVFLSHGGFFETQLNKGHTDFFATMDNKARTLAASQ